MNDIKDGVVIGDGGKEEVSLEAFDYSDAIHSTASLRLERNEKLDNIIIEVDGDNGVKLAFEANERSRNLISQAVNAGETLSMPTASWKMADNSWKEVTLDQLKQASAMGLVRHGQIMAEYS